MNGGFKVWYEQAVVSGTQSPEHPLGDASTEKLVAASTRRYTTPLAQTHSSGSGLFSNYLSVKYAELLAAVDAMSKLPAGDQFHLDEDTARKSHILLHALRFRDAPAPQLFPQDGEALNLTWDLGKVRKFLSIAEDEFSELDLHRSSLMRCEQDLPEFGTTEWNDWLTAFAGHPTPGTEQV